MPWSSASTSSCERICWFMGWSLDDEAREVHVADRALVERRLRRLLFVAGGRPGVLVLVLELDAQGPHRLAHHLVGELLLAGAGQQLLRALVREHHENAVADRRHVG